MNTNMATKSQMAVEKVFQTSDGTWWVRGGIANQEVKEKDALVLREALEAAGGPVRVLYEAAGMYPTNYITNIDVLP